MIFKDLDEVIELANNRPWTLQCAKPCRALNIIQGFYASCKKLGIDRADGKSL